MPNEILSDIKELSYEDLRRAIQAKLNPSMDAMMPVNPGPYKYIEELYPDRAIIEVSGDGKERYYQIPYTVAADETIEFGDPVEVEQVYQPVSMAAKAEDETGGLYAGGAINQIDNLPVGTIAKWTGQSWIGLKGAKAVLTTAQMNALPDSDFAYIDSEGGRHLPINDAAHVRNALARFDQTQFESDQAKAAAKKKVDAAAKKLGIGEPAAAKERTIKVPIPPDPSTDTGGYANKAGQRLQGKMRGMLTEMMDSMSATMGKLKAMMSWANNEDEMPAETPPKMAKKAPEAGFTVYRDKAGKLRWVSRSANAFKDREGEIFKTKALESAVEEADKSADRGPLMIWHVKGTEFGACDFQAVIGRFLVESGTFDETPQGQKAATYFSQHGDTPFEVSIGYQYKATDRADAVYDWLAIKERSVTPPNGAMNPWTAFTTTKEVEQEMALNQTKKEFLTGVFGSEFVADLEAKAEADSKALEKQLDFKAEDEKFDMKALTETLAQTLKPLVDGLQAQAASVAALQTDLKAQGEKIAKMEADATAEAEKAANAPRIAGFYGNRPSDSAPAVSQEEAEKANGLLGVANPNHPLNHRVGVSR